MREFWYCKILIPRNSLHRTIHENIVSIVRPDELTCQMALEELKRLDQFGVLHQEDCFEKRLNLLICLFDDGNSFTAEGLKKQLEIVKAFRPL